MNLIEYVTNHVVRGECKCGKCIDVGNAPDPASPHTVDMIFFRALAQNDPSREEFVRLTNEWKGEYADCNPLDSKEHGFMELGGWIGDQGLALLYMALGTSLGVFNLLTPRTMLPPGLEEGIIMQLAQNGYVSVQAKKSAH